MPDDAPVTESQSTAGAQPAVAEVAPSQATAPRAVDAAVKSLDFDTAFGKREGGSSDGDARPKPAGHAPATRSGEPASAATAGSGADDDDDETGTDGGTGLAAQDGQPQKPPSRVAKLHQEYQGQIGQLKTEHETTVSTLQTQMAQIRAELDRATGKVSESERRQQADQMAFAEAYGDDGEYERLTRINNTSHYTGVYLDADDAEKLARWTTTRTHSEPLRERYLSEARTLATRANGQAEQIVQDARDQFQRYIAAETITRMERYGLDPKVIETAEYGPLLDHAVAVTTQRLAQKHATELQAERDKISQLEADLNAAQMASLGNRSDPLPGGGSADVRVTARRVFDPKAPLDEAFASAFGPRPNGVPR